MSNQTDLSKKRTQWEIIILGCMYVGYMAFILCRTAIQVCGPGMLEYSELGLTKTTFGQILGWGTAGMIAGKLFTGMIADWLGGRKVFIMALSITSLVAIGFGSGHSFVSFAGMNFLMLFAAAAGWPAMASLIAAWYPSNKYGRVWGIISTSSRLSSTLSLFVLGLLVSIFSWNNIFRIAGLVGLATVGLIFFLLKGRPKDVGLAPPVRPAEEEEDSQAEEEHFLDQCNLHQALWAFTLSGRFWLICLSLMCTTVLMEFIGFLPIFLRESFRVAPSVAASATSVFPAGCLLALIGGGFIYDKVTRKGRIALLGGLLAVSCLCIVALWMLPSFAISVNFRLALAIIALFFFGLTVAPAYYLPMSIFSIEFGGKHCGLLIGLIDATGYGASMLYQFAGGKMVDQRGWQSMLILLFVVALAATLITIWFTYQDYRAQLRKA